MVSGETLERMLQACEQDMSATDVALSGLRGVGRLTGKRKRGDELARQPVRHLLWEQDSLEAHNEVLLGCLDVEVEAVYDEEMRLSDGSDSCWSCSGRTQTVWQSQRWAVSHLHGRVLWWWSHWKGVWRE